MVMHCFVAAVLLLFAYFADEITFRFLCDDAVVVYRPSAVVYQS